MTDRIMGPGVFGGPGWRVAFALAESWCDLVRAADRIARGDAEALDRFMIDAPPDDLVVLDERPTADAIEQLVGQGRFVVAIWPGEGVTRAIACATQLAGRATARQAA